MTFIAIEDIREHLITSGSPLTLELGEDHILFHDRTGTGLKTLIALPLSYDDFDNASLGEENGIIISYDKEVLEDDFNEIISNEDLIYRNIEPEDLEELFWELEDFANNFSSY